MKIRWECKAKRDKLGCGYSEIPRAKGITFIQILKIIVGGVGCCGLGRGWAVERLVDPTSPPNYREMRPNEALMGGNQLQVRAVFSAADGQGKVMIGDSVFKVGDRIAGLTIQAISLSEVILKREDGVEIHLPVGGRQIKLEEQSVPGETK